MPYDEMLAERIREILCERSDMTERKMFGGVAFLCNGRMCCGVAGLDLVVRVVPLRGFVYVSPSAPVERFAG